MREFPPMRFTMISLSGDEPLDTAQSGAGNNPHRHAALVMKSESFAFSISRAGINGDRA
jgi:hypothetical protein